MRVMAQMAMVMNLDKCIGCHTCSVTCKQAWTNRAGTEYVWFNNVETRPGMGYPRGYEDQEEWLGGWTLSKGGRLKLKGGGRLNKMLNIFSNPKMPGRGRSGLRGSAGAPGLLVSMIAISFPRLASGRLGAIGRHEGYVDADDTRSTGPAGGTDGFALTWQHLPEALVHAGAIQDVDARSAYHVGHQASFVAATTPLRIFAHDCVKK